MYSGLQSSCNFQESEKRSFPVFPLIFQVLHKRSFVFRFCDLQVLCKRCNSLGLEEPGSEEEFVVVVVGNVVAVLKGIPVVITV